YETPLESARRELFEEAGLTSDNWQEFRQHSVHSKIDYTVHYFIARDCQKMPDRKLDGGEKIKIHQTSLDHFLTDIVIQPNFAEFELKQEILSLFDPDAVARLKQEILDY
ncbi:MAG TPA: NUDIX domain-containing protein, partial [Alphaproteobacteria bacterium]